MAVDPIYASPESLAAYEAQPAVRRRRALLAEFHKLSLEDRLAASRRCMAEVDAMPKHLRALVHEHGLTTVKRKLAHK